MQQLDVYLRPAIILQGLADIVLEEQTSFTIVSNGADCVLVNKQFYLEHASEKLLRKLRHDVSLHLSRLVGKPTMWFPNRSDTIRPVQAQKRARSLKFRI